MAKRLKQLLLIAAALILAATVILYFFASPILSPIIARKISTAIHSHLHAEFQYDALVYRFPYSVHLENARLVSSAGGANAQLISMDRLDLTLAALPIRGGPLVIKNLEIGHPTIHLIRASEEIVGSRGLTKTPAERAQAPPKYKLSEMFELRRFKLTSGTIVYENRTGRDPSPMSFSGIDLDLGVTPEAKALYGCHLIISDRPYLQLDADCKMDIDSLLLDLSKFVISVSAQHDGRGNSLPPKVQQFIDQYEIAGTILLGGAAHVPLRDLNNSTFSADVSLAGGHARVSHQGAVDQLDFLLHADGADAQTQLQLKQFAARSGAAKLDIQQALAEISGTGWTIHGINGTLAASAPGSTTQPATINGNQLIDGVVAFAGNASGRFGSPATYDLTAHVRELAILPALFPQPVGKVTGDIRISDDAIAFSEFTAAYGADQWNLHQARIPLRNIDRGIEIGNIAVDVVFGPLLPEYPVALGRIFKQVAPAGQFSAKGSVILHPRDHQPPDMDLMIRTEGSSLAFADRKIAATNVRAELQIHTTDVALTQAQFDILGGRATARGTFSTTQPIRYEAVLQAEGIDLHEIEMADVLPGENHPAMSGLADISANISGVGPHDGLTSIDGLSASGELEISKSRLWEIPLLGNIAGQSRIKKEALTASDAAAVFSLASQIVTLKRAAISSPVLGLVGRGTIAFDGKVNLDIVAAPLGDWRQQIKRTGIPIISNVAGEIAGGIQRLISTATSNLLYQFRVTGNLTDPVIKTVPTPILTDAAASLFGKMLNGAKQDELLEAVKTEK